MRNIIFMQRVSLEPYQVSFLRILLMFEILLKRPKGEYRKGGVLRSSLDNIISPSFFVQILKLVANGWF